MNRAVFITAGIVVIVAVFVVWLYLFLNGSPVNTNQVFSDLGIVESTERTVDPESSLDSERGTALSLNEGVLQQLATEPIAGFGVASTSRGSILRYVERGTGHIYEINLSSGLKNRIAPTTMAGAVEAVFSPNLERVAIVLDSDQREVRLIELPNTATSESVGMLNLTAVAENLQFKNNETLVYTVNSFTKTVGYEFNATTREVTKLFDLSIPDGAVRVIHGQTYVYPKPARGLMGAAYKVTDDSLTPVSPSENGLVPFLGSSITIANYIDEADARYVAKDTTTNIQQSVTMLPEKCVAGQSRLVWCAAPTGSLDEVYVENWYKGTLSSNDAFWAVQPLLGEASLLALPLQDIGRQIDATNMQLDPVRGTLLFVNKIDSTLWLFNLQS